MTVAVGFQAMHGVVLCADRQLTKDGGLKFEANKIHWRMSSAREQFYNVAFTYSGDPDAAADMFTPIANALADALDHALASEISPHYFINALKPVLKSREAKRLGETLIALQTPEPCFLFRTKGEQIVPGSREFIGCGDSSVIRLVADVTSKTFLEVDKATTLAIYMVLLANRYIDGCGFGADGVVMQANKPMRIMSKGDTAKYRQRFLEFERQMEKEFFAEA